MSKFSKTHSENSKSNSIQKKYLRHTEKIAIIPPHAHSPVTQINLIAIF